MLPSEARADIIAAVVALSGILGNERIVTVALYGGRISCESHEAICRHTRAAR